MAKNEKTEIGFEKFEEDFNAIPGTMLIEKSGEKPEENEKAQVQGIATVRLGEWILKPRKNFSIDLVTGKKKGLPEGSEEGGHQ